MGSQNKKGRNNHLKIFKMSRYSFFFLKISALLFTHVCAVSVDAQEKEVKGIGLRLQPTPPIAGLSNLHQLDISSTSIGQQDLLLRQPETTYDLGLDWKDTFWSYEQKKARRGNGCLQRLFTCLAMLWAEGRL